jgi:hypothetical protein
LKYLFLPFVLCSVASATPLLLTYNYVRYYNLPADHSTYACEHPNGPACIGSSVAPGTNWTVNYASDSSAQFGILRAQAQFFLTGDNSLGALNGGAVPFPNLLSVGARAGFRDSLTVQGGTGQGTMSFQFSVTGTSSASGGATARPVVQYVPIVAGSEDFNNAILYNVVNGIATVPLTFTFGQPTEYEIFFYALTQIFSNQGWASGSAANADYFHTATLTGIDVRDAGGSAVNGFSIISGSGTQYGVNGVVPEPSTYSLVGLGTLALAAIRVRGKKRTGQKTLLPGVFTVQGLREVNAFSSSITCSPRAPQAGLELVEGGIVRDAKVFADFPL